ncbi:hypothetical protein OAP56_02260 [Rickettsiaceae bacterium]|nr:hypothetical protein [Rickettsiaceae bacterium]
MIFEWLLNVAKNWYTGFTHRFNDFFSFFTFDFKIKFLSDDLPLMMHQNTEEDEKILSTENILTARTNHTSNAPLTARKENNDNDIFLDCNSESDDETGLEELRMQCQEILENESLSKIREECQKILENEFSSEIRKSFQEILKKHNDDDLPIAERLEKESLAQLSAQPKEHEWSQEKHDGVEIRNSHPFRKPQKYVMGESEDMNAINAKSEYKCETS